MSDWRRVSSRNATSPSPLHDGAAFDTSKEKEVRGGEETPPRVRTSTLSPAREEDKETNPQKAAASPTQHSGPAATTASSQRRGVQRGNGSSSGSGGKVASPPRNTVRGGGSNVLKAAPSVKRPSGGGGGDSESTHRITMNHVHDHSNTNLIGDEPVVSRSSYLRLRQQLTDERIVFARETILLRQHISAMEHAATANAQHYESTLRRLLKIAHAHIEAKISGSSSNALPGGASRNATPSGIADRRGSDANKVLGSGEEQNQGDVDGAGGETDSETPLPFASGQGRQRRLSMQSTSYRLGTNSDATAFSSSTPVALADSKNDIANTSTANTLRISFTGGGGGLVDNNNVGVVGRSPSHPPATLSPSSSPLHIHRPRVASHVIPSLPPPSAAGLLMNPRKSALLLFGPSSSQSQTVRANTTSVPTTTPIGYSSAGFSQRKSGGGPSSGDLNYSIVGAAGSKGLLPAGMIDDRDGASNNSRSPSPAFSTTSFSFHAGSTQQQVARDEAVPHYSQMDMDNPSSYNNNTTNNNNSSFFGRTISLFSATTQGEGLNPPSPAHASSPTSGRSIGGGWGGGGEGADFGASLPLLLSQQHIPTDRMDLRGGGGGGGGAAAVAAAFASALQPAVSIPPASHQIVPLERLAAALASAETLNTQEELHQQTIRQMKEDFSSQLRSMERRLRDALRGAERESEEILRAKDALLAEREVLKIEYRCEAFRTAEGLLTEERDRGDGLAVERASLQKRISSLEGVQKALEKELTETRATLAGSQRSVAGMQQERGELRHALLALQKKNTFLESTIVDVRAANVSLQEKCDHLAEEKSAAQRSLEESRTREQHAAAALAAAATAAAMVSQQRNGNNLQDQMSLSPTTPTSQSTPQSSKGGIAYDNSITYSNASVSFSNNPPSASASSSPTVNKGGRSLLTAGGRSRGMTVGFVTAAQAAILSQFHNGANGGTTLGGGSSSAFGVSVPAPPSTSITSSPSVVSNAARAFAQSRRSRGLSMVSSPSSSSTTAVGIASPGRRGSSVAFNVHANDSSVGEGVGGNNSPSASPLTAYRFRLGSASIVGSSARNSLGASLKPQLLMHSDEGTPSATDSAQQMGVRESFDDDASAVHVGNPSRGLGGTSSVEKSLFSSTFLKSPASHPQLEHNTGSDFPTTDTTTTRSEGNLAQTQDPILEAGGTHSAFHQLMARTAVVAPPPTVKPKQADSSTSNNVVGISTIVSHIMMQRAVGEEGDATPTMDRHSSSSSSSSAFFFPKGGKGLSPRSPTPAAAAAAPASISNFSSISHASPQDLLKTLPRPPTGGGSRTAR